MFTEKRDILVASPLEGAKPGENKMIETMEDCGRALADVDIQQLEELIGIVLPDGYKRFLLRYNGGRPIPNAFPIEGLENNPFGTIQVFYRIDGSIESSNLDWNYDTLNGRLPPNLLAIACDEGDDQICISLFGDDAGSILFWDCHKETEVPGYHNVYRIAGSFSEFIDGLRELPDAHEIPRAVH